MQDNVVRVYGKEWKRRSVVLREFPEHLKDSFINHIGSDSFFIIKNAEIVAWLSYSVCAEQDADSKVCVKIRKLAVSPPERQQYYATDLVHAFLDSFDRLDEVYVYASAVQDPYDVAVEKRALNKEELVRFYRKFSYGNGSRNKIIVMER